VGIVIAEEYCCVCKAEKSDWNTKGIVLRRSYHEAVTLWMELQEALTPCLLLYHSKRDNIWGSEFLTVNAMYCLSLLKKMSIGTDNYSEVASCKSWFYYQWLGHKTTL